MAVQLQFPVETLAPIATILRGPAQVTVLSGPVGSGKLTAVNQVAAALRLPLRVIFLETEVDVGNLEARLLVALQPTLEGPKVCCVKGAELIKPHALELLAAKPVHAHCVLLSNEKLRGWPRERVVYHPKPSQQLCLTLARELGARDAHVMCTLALGDLRQIAVLASQEKTVGDCIGHTDAAPHAWMDTRDVLAGATRMPPERVLPEWLERNALAGVPADRLDDAAAYFATLAQLDVMGLERGGDGPSSSTMAALATHALRRNLPRLRQLSPPEPPLGARPSALRRLDLSGFVAEASALQPHDMPESGPDPGSPAAAAPMPPEDAASAPPPSAAPPQPEPEELAAATEPAADSAESDAPSPELLGAEPAPADEARASPRTVYVCGGDRLLACAATVRAASFEPGAGGGVFNLATYAEATTNSTARRMTLAVLTLNDGLAHADVAGAWAALAPQVASAAEGTRLWRAPCGFVALVVKKPDARLRLEGWLVQKLRRPDPFPLARALADRESVGTMELAAEARVDSLHSRVTAAEAARHVLEAAPDRDSQLAYMVDLAEAKKNGEALTPVQEFVLRHRRDMKEVVQAVREREALSKLLVEAASARRFPWDFQLEYARVWFADALLNVHVAAPARNAQLIIRMAAERTVVFYGPPWMGKTECARSLAAAMATAAGLSHFPFVNTVESLRKLSEHSLLEPGVPVCLDEFKPRSGPCGAQGGGIDHLKNVVDATHTKTIEARFNDFALPGDCPRIITTQSLNKLVPQLSNAPTAEELRELLKGDDDAQAVLRRLVFVHVAECIHGGAQAPEDDGERARKRRRIDALLAVVEEGRLSCCSNERPPELVIEEEEVVPPDE